MYCSLVECVASITSASAHQRFEEGNSPCLHDHFGFPTHVATMSDSEIQKEASPPLVPDEEEEDEEVPQRTEALTEKQQEEILQICSSDDVIELNSLRLFSFDEIPLAELKCSSLSIRKNLIHELTPFPPELCSRLKELDLFDNKIKRIGGRKCQFFTPDMNAQPPRNHFTQLVKLDLSYNQISTIEGLDALGGTLQELYLVENKIKEISGLDALINLRLLELGGNRLREVGSGLKSLVNLEELWLGKNKIASLGSGFATLKKLRRLSLQANRLTELEPETFADGELPELRELYLSENGLQRIERIGCLPKLELLDFSFNPIQSLNCEGVLNPTHFPVLNEFWLTDGKVDDWKEVDLLQPFQATLRTVYLERNPLEQDKRYRSKVYLALPFLQQIDSWPIVNKGNPEDDRAIRR